MTARDELASIICMEMDFEGLGFDAADAILAAGFVKAGAAEALLEEIRALVAEDALLPSSNTHYELRALLERNPA
jgi:hypothetical protein